MDSFEIVHFPSTASVHDRIAKTKDIILSLAPKTLLDIGGADYLNLCKKHNIEYTTINLETPQTTGGGGYHKAEGTILYNGRDLPFSKNSFDLIVINFVLHHASNNTLHLLKQIRDISARYVLIGEDLSELDYDLKWHKRNYAHQPGGVFRSDEEWRILFNFYNLTLLKQFVIHRDDDINKDHVYRCLYLLEKSV